MCPGLSVTYVPGTYLYRLQNVVPSKTRSRQRKPGLRSSNVKEQPRRHKTFARQVAGDVRATSVVFFCGEVHRVYTRRACSQAGRSVAEGGAAIKDFGVAVQCCGTYPT